MPAETALQDTLSFDPTVPLTYECPPHVLELAQRVLARLHRDAPPFAQALISRLQNEAPVDTGAEKVVYDYKPGQVVAFYRRPVNDKEHLKREFYARKLAHTLLPDRIPNPHFVAIKPSFFIIDKVENYPTIPPGAREETQKKFNTVGFDIDSWPTNFHMDSSGTAVYVDDVWNEYYYRKMRGETSDREVIEGLPEDRQVQAISYMQRLHQLCGIED